MFSSIATSVHLQHLEHA